MLYMLYTCIQHGSDSASSICTTQEKYTHLDIRQTCQRHNVAVNSLSQSLILLLQNTSRKRGLIFTQIIFLSYFSASFCSVCCSASLLLAALAPATCQERGCSLHSSRIYQEVNVGQHGGLTYSINEQLDMIGRLIHNVKDVTCNFSCTSSRQHPYTRSVIRT